MLVYEDIATKFGTLVDYNIGFPFIILHLKYKYCPVFYGGLKLSIFEIFQNSSPRNFGDFDFYGKNQYKCSEHPVFN